MTTTPNKCCERCVDIIEEGPGAGGECCSSPACPCHSPKDEAQIIHEGLERLYGKGEVEARMEVGEVPFNSLTPYYSVEEAMEVFDEVLPYNINGRDTSQYVLKLKSMMRSVWASAEALGRHKGYEEEAIKCHEHCKLAREEGITIGEKVIKGDMRRKFFQMGEAAERTRILEMIEEMKMEHPTMCKVWDDYNSHCTCDCSPTTWNAALSALKDRISKK